MEITFEIVNLQERRIDFLKIDQSAGMDCRKFKTLFL